MDFAIKKRRRQLIKKKEKKEKKKTKLYMDQYAIDPIIPAKGGLESGHIIFGYISMCRCFTLRKNKKL